MAIVTHTHHIHVMTRFRAQVMWRALALLAVGAVTWMLPHETPGGVDRPIGWLGSILTEVSAVPALTLGIAIAMIAFVWQLARPADMGALAWVVAGGALALISLVLVLMVGSGPVYWWLGIGVVVPSMALQVVAALIGHGAAVLFIGRRD